LNLLMSFNLGGTYTHPNVRDSHIAAATRWSAQYLEVTTGWPWSDRNDADPFGVKLDLHRFPWPAGCRVCLIDGDAIIRADCPDPFCIVPATHMGVVANDQDGRADVAKSQREWWDLIGPGFGVPEQVEGFPYFNGGLLVFTPALHMDVWRLVELVYRAHNGPVLVGPMAEQTGMNVGCRALGVPMHYLPATWNRMGEAAWGCEGAMGAYVLHLANIGERRGDKNAVLGSIDWRAVLRLVREEVMA
jgi:hypothetical protein